MKFVVMENAIPAPEVQIVKLWPSQGQNRGGGSGRSKASKTHDLLISAEKRRSTHRFASASLAAAGDGTDTDLGAGADIDADAEEAD